MADERAGIEIPNHWNAIALEKLLRGFGGAPVRCEASEIANYQPFDIWLGRFIVIAICAHVADVRIREADNLA